MSTSTSTATTTTANQLSGETVPFQLQDGKIVQVFKEFCTMSETMTDMLADMGVDLVGMTSDANQPLIFTNGSNEYFLKVVELCKYHYTRPKKVNENYEYDIYNDPEIKKNDPETYKALREIHELEKVPTPTPIDDKELQIILGGKTVDECIDDICSMLKVSNFLDIRMIEDDERITDGYASDVLMQIIANRLNETESLNRADGIAAMCKILGIERDITPERDVELEKIHGWCEGLK